MPSPFEIEKVTPAQIDRAKAKMSLLQAADEITAVEDPIGSGHTTVCDLKDKVTFSVSVDEDGMMWAVLVKNDSGWMDMIVRGKIKSNLQTWINSTY